MKSGIFKSVRDSNLAVTESILLQIDEALVKLPSSLVKRSGSVFYSGKHAFSGASPLYLLGLNPGGDPITQKTSTISKHINDFWLRTAPWSAYADESWGGATPGKRGMQPRVLHMISGLNLDPHDVPASNVVFVRSRREADLQNEKKLLLEACWPVHDAVIRALGVRVVVCFGKTAGHWVRERMQANQLFDEFRETNARRWLNQAHRASDGKVVVTVTHPSIVDWRNPATDPTDLLSRTLSISSV